MNAKKWMVFGYLLCAVLTFILPDPWQNPFGIVGLWFYYLSRI